MGSAQASAMFCTMKKADGAGSRYTGGKASTESCDMCHQSGFVTTTVRRTPLAARRGEDDDKEGNCDEDDYDKEQHAPICLPGVER
jgi:hypothetical protein